MAARAGAGLLLQPEVLVAEELASGRLVRVLEDYTPEPRPVHLLWRQDLRPLPKLTQFIAHIMQALPVAVPA
jgi:DNA-binding transcriptional LysR family regulator